MKVLTLVFDPRCPPCRRWARWVAYQPAYVRLTLLSARDPNLRARYPSLAAADDVHAPLTALGEHGEVWRGERALRVSLWALREHRQASFDPHSTALALSEHDAALLEHRVRPAQTASWPRPAVVAMAPIRPPRGSWIAGLFQGLAVGVMGLVLLPVLLLVGFAACAVAYEKAGVIGALGMLLLLALLLAKGLGAAERRT